MRLVLVHGINQQDSDAASIEVAWTGWLRAAMAKPAVLAETSVVTPFYGKVLDQLTRGVSGSGAIAQGADAIDADELAFVVRAMDEVAIATDIRTPAIAAEMRADGTAPVAQGKLLESCRANAIARLIERVSPAHGRFVLRTVRQAYAYLRKPGVAPAIDAIVLPHLEAGPAVVVAHSLGTVVTFKLMRALAQAGRSVTCPLYVTLGSPLAVSAVSAALGVPFEIPTGVAKWINAVEPNDNVTLGKPLDRTTFCSGIQNIMDVANAVSDSAHDAEGYLGDGRIASLIESALR